MLKDITLHVDQDEERQRSLEGEASEIIQKRQRQNLNAFRHTIPSIYEQILSAPKSAKSILCNKHGQLNIVDYQSGRVFYDEFPQDEVTAQVNSFLKKPTIIHNENIAKGEAESEVMVIMGIGLGHHIASLFEKSTAKHYIIYEPDFAFFMCSLSAISWQDIFRLASREKKAIYLQIGKDGRGVASDLNELAEHVHFSTVSVFKHYNHPVFDQVMAEISRGTLQTLSKWYYDQKKASAPLRYTNYWPTESTDKQYSKKLDQAVFDANIAAFEKFFPEIAKEFKSYQPDIWYPVTTQSGGVNVLLTPLDTPLYGDNPRSEGQRSARAFSENPNKDGLLLSYNGKKLKNHLHYQMVTEMSQVTDDVTDDVGTLPDNIKSLILFGMGVGYSLESLLEKHATEMLFICEPNRDFFYASLYAINWSQILTNLDESDARLYLNIGDDGSHLIDDLIKQFHSIGPYVLANTFFFEGYYNANLVTAIAQLREQLKVIVAMGDYFDHAFYGVSHTKWSFEQEAPLLRSDSAEQLSIENKDVPVFLVGNGPSLDNLIEVIRESANDAIIVSCGTALQTLHRHGIQPDFHAEIESNRSTFDWAVRVGSLDYLKQITLISCNGIHPDTCQLYKEVYLAFKEGESSTVSIGEVIAEQDYAKLRYAYPTVANFGYDFFQTAGFTQLYFFGIDMGFADPKYHHSRSSGYYDDEGKERYDYSKENDTSIIVEGNFRAKVNTKFEFKVSKRVLEQAISPHAAVYNVSDGAKIYGSMPLRPENVFVSSDTGLKIRTLTIFKERCFLSIPSDAFRDDFNNRYSKEYLLQEMEALLRLLDEEYDSLERAHYLVKRQRELLVLSYQRKRSLLFFYLNGTLNYVNSAFTRAIMLADESSARTAFNELLVIWRKRARELFQTMKCSEGSFDFISSFEMERRRLYMKLRSKSESKKSVGVYPSTDRNIHRLFDALSVLGITGDLTHCFDKADYQLYFGIAPEKSSGKFLCIVNNHEQLLHYLVNDNDYPILYLVGDISSKNWSPSCNDVLRLFLSRIAVSSELSRFIVLPKLVLSQYEEVDKYYDLSLFESYHTYDCSNFIFLSKELLTTKNSLFEDGTRARYLPRGLKNEDFVSLLLSPEEIENDRSHRLKQFTSLAISK